MLYNSDYIGKLACHELVSSQGLSVEAIVSGLYDEHTLKENEEIIYQCGPEIEGRTGSHTISDPRRLVLLLTAVYKLYEFGNKFLEAAQVRKIPACDSALLQKLVFSLTFFFALFLSL